MALPSPAMQTVRCPVATAAPRAAGMSYPIEAHPEFQNIFCPGFETQVWNNATQAVPFPATMLASAGHASVSSCRKWYGFTPPSHTI